MRVQEFANVVLRFIAACGLASVAIARDAAEATTAISSTAGPASSAIASPPTAPDRTRYGDPAEYEARDRPVTEQDLEILARASELLMDAAAWNRADDRECADDEAIGKRSLFCALQVASIEVLGRYDHRRVALQEVRFAIEKRIPGREFEHRLMGFNNLPSTTLADVQAVLEIARDRVAERLRGGDAGVNP